MTREHVDPSFQSALRTFIDEACENSDTERGLALIETRRGIDKWCTQISHLETAFGKNTSEFRFRQSSREVADFIRGPVASSIAAHQSTQVPLWLVGREFVRGVLKAKYGLATLTDALESLEAEVDTLLIFNEGHAWVYVNEDSNVYLSHSLARLARA